MKNLDEIIKSMQSLKDEVEKQNSTLAQLNETIESLESELAECANNETDELTAVKEKWNNRRSEITKDLADKRQKKHFIESSGASLNEAVALIESLFRLNAESVPKEDVKESISALHEKYIKSSFESDGLDDLSPDDFNEQCDLLGLNELANEDDNEEQAE